MEIAEPLTWSDLRARVLERDGRRCTVGWLLGGRCARTLDIHHIVPRKEGGANDEDNLMTACHHHHPQVEAIRREIMRRRGWRRCPHRPGTHRYPEGNEACERRLNRHLVD
jgi:5-methylcytosine-specific restriction endonuclease McrA